MVRLGRPGAGFSSIDPNKAVDTIAGILARNRMKKRRRSSRSSPTPTPTTKGIVIEVSPGLYKYTDPKTGKLSFTSSEEFARTSSVSGTPVFTQEYQETYRRGGGSSSTPIAFATEQAAIQASQARQLSKLASVAKTEKSRIELEARRDVLLSTLARREQSLIIRERSRLIKQGAKGHKVFSTEVETGDKLEVTNWRLKDGTRVQKVKNLTKGTTSYSYFSRVNGRIVRTMGTIGGTGTSKKVTASDIAAGVKIKKSNDPNKLIITFPNGHKGFISAKGTVIVGANLAGNKYMFKDGVIIAVDGKTTFAREEFVSSPEVQPKSKIPIKGINADREKIISRERTEFLIKRNTAKISSLEKDLGNTAKGGDFDRLGELQRKKTLTGEERKEKNRLQKKVANNYKKASSMIGLAAANALISLGIGSIDLVSSLSRDPIGTLNEIPTSLWKGIKQDLSRATSSSTGAINVITEYLTLAGVFKGVGKVSKNSLKALSKLNPKYVKLINGKYVVKKAPLEIFKVKGTTKFLAKRVQKPSIKRPFSSAADFLKGRKPGQFKKFTKDPGLILKTQTVKSGAKTLSEQAKLAGTEVTAVNAAADQITSWLKRKKVIRKPIPGEAQFPKNIKTTLKKFDNGTKLSNKEFASVNLWLQKNVAPNITLLERSLYLDPAAGLRISRLGIVAERTATLKDILKGNFRLLPKTKKPQVLIFENAKIAKFPKSLQNVKNKLMAGKPLTVAETNKLIRWQVKTGSGQFKPIGSTIYNLGKELEITLAPGEFIKRIKKVGFTFIDGKKVKFVTAEIYKPTKELLLKIKKANDGKLSIKQVTSLEKILSKKLGRRIKIETPKLRELSKAGLRRADSSIPVLRVKGSGLVNVLSKARRLAPRKPTVRKPTVRKPTVRKPTVRKVSPRKPTVRKVSPRTPIVRKATPVKPTTRKPTVRRTAPRPSTKKKPVVVPRRLPKGFKKRTIQKAVPVYYVVIRKGGKMVKLNANPLTLKDSRDYGAFRVDHGLSRSFWFVPVGTSRRVITLPKAQRGYYSKTSKNYRPFKIKAGKKKGILNGYIEKSRYIASTSSERILLAKAKKKASIKRKAPPKKSPKKKTTIKKKKRL